MPSWRGWALLAAVIILSLILGIGLLFYSPWTKRYLVQRLEQYLATSQGLTLQLDKLDYSLFDLSVSVSGLSLRATAAPDLNPFLTIDQIKLDFSLRSFLQGLPFIEQAELEGTAIQLLIDERGESNFLQAGSPSATSAPSTVIPSFLITSLNSRGGYFLFHDERLGVRLELPQWQLQMTGERTTLKHGLHLLSNQVGTLVWQGNALPLDHVELHADLTPSNLTFTELAINSGSSLVQLRGTLEDFASPRLNLQVPVRLNTGDLKRLGELDYAMAGSLTMEISINGSLGAPQVVAHLSGESLLIGALDQVQLDTQLSWSAGEDQILIQSAALGSPLGRIRGSGELALSASEESSLSRIDAQLNRLDLSRLSQLAGWGVELASLVSGDLQASWSGLLPKEAQTRGRLQLRNTRPQTALDVLPLSGEVSFEASDQEVQVLVSRLAGLGIAIDGQMNLNFPEKLTELSSLELRGQLRGEVEKLPRLTGDLDRFLGRSEENSIIPFETEGDLEFTLSVGGTLGEPQFLTHVSAPALRLAAFHELVLGVEAEYDLKTLTLHDVLLQSQKHQLRAQGEISWDQPDPALRLEARLEPGSIAEMLTVLGPPLPMEGTVGLNASIAGTLAQPLAKVSIEGTDLVLYHEPMGSLRVEAEVENSTVAIRHLQLNKPSPEGDGTLSAQGSYHLDSGTFTLETEGKNLRLTQLLLPGDLPIRGLLNFSGSARGDLVAPLIEAKVDADQLEVRGQSLGSMRAAVESLPSGTDIRVHFPEYGFLLQAKGQPSAPYPLEFELTADNTDLASLPLKLPEGFTLQGKLSGNLSGVGELEHWKQSQVQVLISDLQLLLNGYPIRNNGLITGSLSEDFLEVQTGILQLDQSQLQIAGRIPLQSSDAPGFLEASADADLASLLNLFPIRPQLAAEGELKARGTFRGSLERFEPSLQLSVTRGSLQDDSLPVPIREIGMDLRLENGSLILNQVEGLVSGGRFEIQGEVPLAFLPVELPSQIHKKSGPAKIDVRLHNLELESLGVLPESVGGTLSVRVEAEASGADLKDISGQALFDELKVSLSGQQFEQENLSRFSMESGVLSIDRLSLIGSDLQIRGSGTADFTSAQTLNLLLQGDLDAGVLARLFDGLQAAGTTTLRLAVQGQPQNPQISGSVEMQGGEMQLRFPELQAQDLSMRLKLDQGRITIEQLQGALNGGTFQVSGDLGYAGSELRDVQINLTADTLFLDLPRGLKSISKADLRLRSQGEALILDGRADILEGTYREPIFLEGGLLQYLRAGTALELEDERNPLLTRLAFNVTVNTVNPMVVDNNLAKLLMTANLRLAGNYYRPALIGRIALEPGGEFYFHEKTFLVERGTISFFDETRIRPELDILARTYTRGYEIALQVSGDLDNLETNLNSDPVLAKSDIVAVLLTGRTLESLRGAEMTVATEQAFSYLAGRGSGVLGESAERALGLSQVRIEPNLIAPESTPGARLTVGQDLTSNLHFTYSMNLVDSRDQIYIGEYDITRGFRTRGVRQNDNTYRLELGHELRFGDSSPQSQGAQSIFGPSRQIGEVSFSGNSPFPEKRLIDTLRVKPGNTHDFFKVQTGVERLNRLFQREDLLEARIRLQRATGDSQVDLKFTIESGPRVGFLFEGGSISGSLQKRVREIWAAGISDNQRAQEAVATIRKSLLKDGYWQSRVSHSVSYPSENQKQVIFRVEPGVRYREVALVFEGNSAMEPSRLEESLQEGNLIESLGTEPNQVTDFLTRFYRQAGYLDVQVEQPRYLFDPEKSRVQVVISVHEGAAFRVSSVGFPGSRVFDQAVLLERIPLKPGEIYRRPVGEESRKLLEQLYWRRGHNEVHITQSARRLSDQALVEVLFEIEENRQEVVEDIQISGNRRSSDNFVRKQLLFDVGEVLDFDNISRSRKNLYDTGAFSLVEIETEEITTSAPEDNSRRPMKLFVNLRETLPFSFRYGAFYDTDRGPGIIADLTNRNSLGGARLLGIRGRYDSDVRELRGYFSQPALPGILFKTNIGGFVRRELHQTFITDLLGYSIEQETRLKKAFVFSFGYRFERNKTFDRDPDSLFDIPPFHVASLTATLGRDSRDDFLDATRGSFTSHALQYAPSALGSDLQFIKYLGQYFKYFPLSQATEVPYSGGLKRPRLIFASGLRLGLARGLAGQIIVPNERFFAGGGTTIRGFGQDEVGPKDEFFGDPLGGDALFIFNNELRFPIFNILDGVSFLDLGNVYPSISDFDPFDVRISAGLGLRVRTPYFLVRFDFGWKLDRQPDEKAGALFFSIGQAF